MFVIIRIKTCLTHKILRREILIWKIIYSTHYFDIHARDNSLWSNVVTESVLTDETGYNSKPHDRPKQERKSRKYQG